METALPKSAFPKVLHLEDDKADAELVRRMLLAEWPKCTIRLVQTKDEFLDGLGCPELDLVLSDFSMPKFDGLSALLLARRSAEHVPFVFMSGTIGEENAVRALHQGATDYVIKDRPARFIPAVRRALEATRADSTRKAAESGLRASEARFMQLAQQCHDVIWYYSCDVMRRTYVSPAFERIWGISVAAVYSDPTVWERAIHPNDRGIVRDAFEACLAGTKAEFDVEYRIVGSDGQEHWISDSGSGLRAANGAVDRICGLAKDITRLKQAEQHALDQAELLDKARDAIVLVDLSRQVLFWNNGAERAFQRPASAAVGRDAQSILGEEACTEVEKALLPAAQGEWNGTLRLKKQLGSELVADCRVTVIRDDAGIPKSYLIIATDVTERTSLEQQFLRTQRLESIGMLAGGIAHDLNNALAPVLMGVELLRQRIQDAEQRRLLSLMYKSARHGADLVKQVLAFSRGAEGERNPMEAEPVIREVVTLMTETLPKSIAVSCEIEAGLSFIESNSTHLSQVLVNLCVNGRDAMPGGGHLIVAGRNVQVTGAQAGAHPGAAAGPHVLVSVSDNGTGIPAGILDRIFDPFFSTKGPAKGTGLGLSTVLGIVRSHKGFIEIQTSPKDGTRFNLYFPACSGGLSAAPTTPADLVARGQGQRILVIDDEENILQICKILLDAAGYTTICASRGSEGIEKFQKDKETISVVITDLMMPEMQGQEVIRRLREISPNLPIIATSGVPPSGADPIEEDGRTFFLRKPMNAVQLEMLVQKVLSKASP